MKILGILKEIILISLLVFAGFAYYTSSHNTTQLHGTTAHKISEGVAQGTTKIVHSISKTEIDARIAAEVSKQVIKAKAEIYAQVKGNWAGKNNEHSKLVDRYKTKKKTLEWKDGTTGETMPIGVAIYSPKHDRWTAKAYNLKFKTQIVRTIDKDGGVHNTVALSAKPAHLKGWENKNFPINMDLNQSVFTEVENSIYFWSWWNPTLSLGGVSLIGPNGFRTGAFLKFNFMNYGYKSQLPVWQVLSPSLILSNSNLIFGIEFISYNLGEILPVIKDLHIGAGIDTNKDVIFSIASVF